MLTAYQVEVARVVAEIVGPEGFALAGGAAMIAHGIVDRATKDLDFFAAPPTNQASQKVLVSVPGAV